MKKNVCSADRMVRLIVAAVLIGLYAAGILTGTVGIVGLVIAGVMAVTAAFSFCPLYAVLGCCRPCGKGKCDENKSQCGEGQCGSKDKE